MTIDVYGNFNFNLEKAKNLIDLIEMKRVRDELTSGILQRSVDTFLDELYESFPIFKFYPALRPLIENYKTTFRNKIRPQIDEHLKIDVETFQLQAIVLSITALEAYLRDRYVIEKNKTKTEKQIENEIYKNTKSFQREDFITQRYKEIGIDNVLDIIGLKHEIISILNIRHIIVHRGGSINEQFCDKYELSKRDWKGETILRYFFKNPGYVIDCIRTIEAFVARLEKEFI